MTDQAHNPSEEGSTPSAATIVPRETFGDCMDEHALALELGRIMHEKTVMA